MAWSGLADDRQWPADGQAIRFRVRSEESWQEGYVAFVWCGIEPAIKLTNGKNIFPTLGDEWRTVE